MSNLIPKHGGFRNLKTFQLARLIYDITMRFCRNYIKGRTFDQMVQAARSGVQNIAEGSQASGTSKKTEIVLTNVARASLEELRLDFEDFLRQKELKAWEKADPRRNEIVKRKFTSDDEFSAWINEQNGDKSENAANAALVLIAVTCHLLNRQIDSLATSFEVEGGFSERAYRFRKANNTSPKNP